jgi:hypothetical protein
MKIILSLSLALFSMTSIWAYQGQMSQYEMESLQLQRDALHEQRMQQHRDKMNSYVTK